MKKLVDMAAAPLRHTPVDRGEQLAWWLFLALTGFGIGWGSAVSYWAAWCLPAV